MAAWILVRSMDFFWNKSRVWPVGQTKKTPAFHYGAGAKPNPYCIFVLICSVAPGPSALAAE